MEHQQSAIFWDVQSWQAGIAAAVQAGLTFRAEAPGCGNATWIIIYTGGY